MSYERSIDDASIADWSTIRMTGFSARCTEQDRAQGGYNPWDKFSGPTINQDITKTI